MLRDECRKSKGQDYPQLLNCIASSRLAWTLCNPIPKRQEKLSVSPSQREPHMLITGEGMGREGEAAGQARAQHLKETARLPSLKGAPLKLAI